MVRAAILLFWLALPSLGLELIEEKAFELPAGGPLVWTEKGILLRNQAALLLCDAEGKELKQLPGHEREVHALAATPDARVVVTGGADRTVRVWDLAAGKLERTLAGHKDEVDCVAVSPDGKHALSGGRDGQAILWDLKKGSALATFSHQSPRKDGSAAFVNGVACGTGGLCISAGDDRAVLWRKGKELAELARSARRASHVAFAAGKGTTALVADMGGRLVLWSEKAGAKELQAEGGKEVMGLAVLKDGKLALTIHGGGELVAWDLDRAAAVARVRANESYGPTLGLSPGGDRVLVTDGRKVKVFRLAR